MRRQRLLPQTVTILADYASIGYRNTEVDPACLEDEREDPPAAIPQPAASCPAAAAAAPPQYYKVRTEPFVPTQADELATLGVGRIPLESLGDSSVFFVRGLLRERLGPSSAAPAHDCQLRRSAALASVRDGQPGDRRRVQNFGVASG